MSMTGFVEKSVHDTVSFFRDSVFSDEIASRRGFFQAIDPRVKFVSVIMFIGGILFTKSVAACGMFYALCLAIAALSRVDLVFFLKRTWIFIPLFSLFIALPAIFGAVTPGDTFFSFPVFGAHVTVTRQGVMGAALFVSRVITSVSFSVLLSITTKHFELLAVLRVVRVPQIFVMILGMCYRYIYLFAEIIENTYLAMKSRTGGVSGCRRGQKLVAWNIALLWYRSYRLNDDVYNAMISRGYSGEPVISHTFNARAKDWIWLLFSFIITAAILFTGCCIWKG